MSTWQPEQARMKIAIANKRSNCIGTALFLTGCIDYDIEVYPASFGRDLPKLLDGSDCGPGKLIALYEGSALRHMAIIDGEQTVTHRYLRKVSSSHSLDRLIRTYAEVMQVTARFYSPGNIMLSPYHYSALERERFLAKYQDKQLIQGEHSVLQCAEDSRLSRQQTA